MNSGEKKWYESTTIKSGIIAMIMFVVQITGVDLDNCLITEFITGVLGVIAISMTIYGRIKAKYVIR